MRRWALWFGFCGLEETSKLNYSRHSIFGRNKQQIIFYLCHAMPNAPFALTGAVALVARERKRIEKY
jgi:hypothetical protein